MSIECLAEMIVEIDKKPPVTDEEFEEAVAHWREREREMPREGRRLLAQRSIALDHALALITRKEIENIISLKRFRRYNSTHYKP